ncbi:Hypothetical Protein FCC1311_034832 [Hondaea fermentalgiana]|uniref:F-box domain-containing protein n=1 Tax=Hondaea fermentalgiana TaxID=2315210 RepID=A0A2R5GG85_9STRA|nr:Hypothetical Protein FCC1311_034832 [Hondaea fermentalgiana]|eukprot:GBG27261.1 Hypothetical Protein FCC1311_034832 [Hondaea fermentalgiana]
MPLSVPGQHDVTAAFLAVDIPSSRENSHIAWDENLRSRVSALFDPEDRPPLAQATESDAAKVAIAVGVVTKSGLAEAEKAIKNGRLRPKWSGMAEGAFHALETGTMWPTGAFWLRISLAIGDSSTPLALKCPPCDEIAPQVESRARIFPEFVLTKLLEYCDEKSILALADTCKTSYFFMNSRWKQVMKSSYLVTHFMKPRANMRVQLPPPGFTPRQFLQMLASEACAECGSKDLDWLKEHSVFTDVAIGRLRIGKDRDRILSIVREAMACEKELDDLEHKLHPLTSEAIDRRKLLLVEQSVTPSMVSKVLKRISEALRMVKMPDVAVLNRLRCLTYYDSLRPEGVDFDEIIMEGDVEEYVRFGKVFDGRPVTFLSKNSDDVHNFPRDIFDLHVERLRSQKQPKRALEGHAKDHVETAPKSVRDNLKRRKCNDKRN